MHDSNARRVVAPKLDRGVYWAAARRNGKLELFAVDSTGNEIKRIMLQDDSWRRAEATIEFLWRLLDMKDPVTTVVKVRPLFVVPETTRPARLDDADPYATIGVPGHLREPW